MIRNLKALGLTVIAALAMTALAASAAQAQVPTFTADEYPAFLHADQVEKSHLFTVAGGRQVTCEIATFTGELTKASQTMTISPKYEKCHANILGAVLPATVDMGGCDYHFTALATQNPEKPDPHQYTGDVGLVCPENKDVLIRVFAEKSKEHKESERVCEYTVQAGQTLSTIDYENMTEGAGTADDTVTVRATVSGVTYTRLFGTLANCGAESSTATYTGNTLAKGKNEAKAQIGGRVSD